MGPKTVRLYLLKAGPGPTAVVPGLGKMRDQPLTRGEVEQWLGEQAQKAAQPTVPRWVLIGVAAIIVVGLLAVIFIK
jgi:hypothetical protein